MKTVRSYEEENAVICAVKITEDMQSAIDVLEHNCRVLPVIHEDENVMCQTDKIYYIESIDKGPMFIQGIIAMKPNIDCMSWMSY